MGLSLGRLSFAGAALAVNLLLAACGGGSGTAGGAGSDAISDTPPVADGSSKSPPASPADDDQPLSRSGIAIMGPLAAASVELYPVTGLAGPPIYRTITSDGDDLGEVGLFSLPEELIEPDMFYLVKVRGGRDKDADDDGLMDSSSTPNRGSLRALLSGAEIQTGNFHVSPLTEAVYQRLRYLLAGDYPVAILRSEIDYRARVMLKGDVDGDNDVDGSDLVAWHPRRHRDLLRHGWERYAPLIAAVHRGEEPVAAALDLSAAVIGKMSTRKGTVYDVAVAGRYAYEVDQTSLMVVDVAAPEKPTLLATLPMDAAHAVTVAGDVVFVANGASGLAIVDVRVAARPRLMATVAGLGNVVDVTVSGDLAYLAGDSATLSVVDISNPAAPVAIGGLALGHPYQQALGVAVMGKYVLVAVQGAGLAVVDASDPRVLRKIAQLDGNNITDVAAQGSYAYVTDAVRGLCVVDLSNPVQPRVIAELAMPYGRSITVSGAHAYLSTGGLSIVNIEKPALPQLVGYIDGMSWANGSDVANGWVYVADANDGLLVVAPGGAVNSAITKTMTLARGALDEDFGDFFGYTVNRDGLTASQHWEAEPGNPTPRPLSFKLDLRGGAQAIDVQDGHAYLASGQNGFRVVASSGIDRPRLEGELPVTWTRAVVSQGDIAYTLRTGVGLEILDIRDPARPKKIGTYASGSEGRGLALQGDTLFAIDGNLGLTVFDVSDPTAPRRLGQWNSGIEPWSIAIANGYVYIVDRSGLAVVDVGDPSSPHLVGRYLANPLRARVAVQNTHVYMAVNETLSIIDVADPARPTLLGMFTSADYIEGLAPAGVLMYITTLNSGLFVLNVSNPGNPVVRGTWKHRNSPHAIFAKGNRVYTASYDEFSIVDVTNPAAPFLLGRVSTQSWSQQISITANKALVAAGSAGLKLIDLSDEDAPALQGHYIMSPSNVTDVVAAGDVVYAADRDLGVFAVDVSQAAAPAMLTTLPLAHGAERLAMEGNHIYAINWWGLSIIDGNDPDAPLLIAELDALGARAVLVRNGLVYIATTTSELLVVDVAVPAAPVLRNRLYLPVSGQPYHLDIHGDMLYMSMSSSLHVFDVGEPTQPRWLAATPIPGGAFRVGAYAGSVRVATEFGVVSVRPLLHGLP